MIDLLVIVVSLAIIGLFMAIHDPTTREAHTPVAHDQPAGDGRALPEVMRAGKLVPPDFAESAVFFTRSAEVAAYFACLRGEKEERRSAGVLTLDRSSLRQSYRLEPDRYDPFDGRNEREEAVWGRIVSFRRHLLGVVSEVNVSEVLGPPEWLYLPPGFVRWPEARRRKFNERQLASGREFVAKGRAAVRDLIVAERFLKSKMG